MLNRRAKLRNIRRGPLSRPAVERTTVLIRRTPFICQGEGLMWRPMRRKPNEACRWIRFNERAPRTRWRSRRFRLTGGLWCLICDAGRLGITLVLIVGFISRRIGIYWGVGIHCPRRGPFPAVVCTSYLLAHVLYPYPGTASLGAPSCWFCRSRPSDNPKSIQSCEDPDRLRVAAISGAPRDARSISVIGCNGSAVWHETAGVHQQNGHALKAPPVSP